MTRALGRGFYELMPTCRNTNRIFLFRESFCLEPGILDWDRVWLGWTWSSKWFLNQAGSSASKLKVTKIKNFRKCFAHKRLIVVVLVNSNTYTWCRPDMNFGNRIETDPVYRTRADRIGPSIFTKFSSKFTNIMQIFPFLIFYGQAGQTRQRAKTGVTHIKSRSKLPKFYV